MKRRRGQYTEGSTDWDESSKGPRPLPNTVPALVAAVASGGDQHVQAFTQRVLITRSPTLVTSSSLNWELFYISIHTTGWM